MIGGESESCFVTRFGHLYEHSSWIIRAAWAEVPFADARSLIAVTSRIVRESGADRQKALVQAHPELARKFGVDPDLGTHSASEQAGVGLDRLTRIEFDEFRVLNEAYRARFRMPFVICARGATKDLIRSELIRRLEHAPETELDEALTQIDQIAYHRLKDVLAL